MVNIFIRGHMTISEIQEADNGPYFVITCEKDDDDMDIQDFFAFLY